MKFSAVILSVIAAVIASYLTVTIMQPASVSEKIEKQESAYDRIMRTKNIPIPSTVLINLIRFLDD